MTRRGLAELGSSERALVAEHDVLLLDLDGVVYVGADPVSHAVEALESAAAEGVRLAFVTNNAARPPSEVAEHLCSFGLQVSAEDVVTSAQAAARLMTQHVEPGAKVFVIGGKGLQLALEEQGLVPVASLDDDPAAVISGYHPSIEWRSVIHGAIGVRKGLPWVASNTDSTVPTPYGPGPGTGVLVQLIADFADVAPQVAGKPETPLFEETILRVGGQSPLVVGDRLDTDIEGGNRADLPTLLVMTGVCDVAALAAATPGERPTYIAHDLRGLSTKHSAPHRTDDAWTHGPWTAHSADGALRVQRAGRQPDQDQDLQTIGGSPGLLLEQAHQWWQIVATACWAWSDEHGSSLDITTLDPPSLP